MALTTQTFESLNPATGEVVGTHPVHGPEEVASVVRRAREAAQWWSALGYDGRRDLLGRWRALLARRMSDLAELVHEENGKPRGDAELEIALAVDHLAWAAGHARKVLGPHRVSPGLLLPNQAASVEYQPLGVVGVIGPWNYPVFTPMGSIAYALAAGNAVVFKPSEYTPGVGQWLAATFAEVVPDHPVFSVVTGLGETGAALCASGVDKIAFTGSAATGRKVMAACADDADAADRRGGRQGRAARRRGRRPGRGRGRGGVGRDVERRPDLHRRGAVLRARAGLRRLRAPGAGAGRRAHGGRRTPREVSARSPCRRSSDHPAAHRGRAGPRRPGRARRADAVGERYVQPTVLVDVPEDSAAVTEETFGPTVTITKVPDMDTAVRLANATRYGLGSTVFSGSRGMELARRLRSGMTSVNSMIAFAGIPSLPFGGIGDSGFGRIHGADGLREFTYAKAIARQRVRPIMALTTFRRTPKTERAFARLIGVLHGRGALPRRR